MAEGAGASPLRLEIKREGTTAVVRCHGKLVAGVNNVFYARVKELMPDSRRIVLDLTELTRVDSMGLGTLVRLYVHARSENCELVLINLGKQVRQLLALTNLLTVFTVVGEHGIRIG